MDTKGHEAIPLIFNLQLPIANCQSATVRSQKSEVRGRCSSPRLGVSAVKKTAFNDEPATSPSLNGKELATGKSPEPAGWKAANMAPLIKTRGPLFVYTNGIVM